MTKLTDEEVRTSRALDRGTAPPDVGGTSGEEMLSAARQRLLAINQLPHSGPRGVSQSAREALRRAQLNAIAELEGKPAPYVLRKRTPSDDTVWPVGDPRGPKEKR